jgi:flagellar protein FliO/FliZ
MAQGLLHQRTGRGHAAFWSEWVLKPLQRINSLRALRHAGAGAGVAVLALHAHAAVAAGFAAPTLTTPAATAGGAGGLLRVSIALLVVLAAVLGTAWLARRVRGLTAAGNGGLEILSQLPLGARERAVLIRVGDRQLLLGVGSGGVRTLHVLDAPGPSASASGAAAIAAPPARPNFRDLLLRSLGK